ncbi:hypothetical protein WG901_13170 [Novosphingobium sp. PS1R-30]|uniref:DUF2946 domain-containing protein n=1 Tax=Novosphingobium anseongense TaxID=3133436 RepID=A0ABU8RWY2_9SPHN|nr:MAG: hypothetical protein EOO76_02930 [Novosphingobium sp.]
MLRRGLLLLCLLLTSLMATSAVHANEQSPAPVIDCSGQVHVDGDTDQSAPDSDQGVPHHHTGCHGHGTFDAFPLKVDAIGLEPATRLFFFPASSVRARWMAGPALRPPIA